MKIEIYQEICCDYCNDVIHNHIDCPACKKEYASTDAYHCLIDWYDYGEVRQIACEECGAKFRTVKTDGFLDDWEWEQINES